MEGESGADAIKGAFHEVYMVGGWKVLRKNGRECTGRSGTLVVAYIRIRWT